MTRGVDYGPRGLIIHWYSEDGRFAIIKETGHSHFSGRGQQAYGCTCYNLIDTKKEKRDMAIFFGLSIKEFEGRFSKKTMKECTDIINDILAKELSAPQVN